MDHPFRSAAVGGFNKQDVLTFLEEQSKQAAQAQQQLSDQLEEVNQHNENLRQEGDDLRRQLEELQRELEDLRQERDGLRVQLDAAERDLTVSRRQAGQTARELDRALDQRDELQARLEAALPDAQAYVQIKERTAGVELDAHRRAQAIQEKAEGNAQKLRRQTEQWLARLAREYDALRSQVETTISHAASELEKAELCLDQVGQLMASQETALEGLSAAYDRTDPSRVDAPVPLPEE